MMCLLHGSLAGYGTRAGVFGALGSPGGAPQPLCPCPGALLLADHIHDESRLCRRPRSKTATGQKKVTCLVQAEPRATPEARGGESPAAPRHVAPSRRTGSSRSKA